MKHKLLLSALVAALFASCSSAYKATQTPDDVYYSPAHAIAQKDDEEDVRNDRRRDKYEEYTSAEDRYLRMKVRDRYRWSSIDDYSYWYDTRYTCNNINYYKNNIALSYGFNNCNCACYTNSYSSIFNPGYYNPYYTPHFGYGYGYYPGNIYIINNPKVRPNVNRPQLGGYRNNSYNNNNNIGNTLKKVFSPNTNGYSNRNSSRDNNTYRSTERTYSPSSPASSSGSGSSNSGGGRTSRPGRN